MIEGSYLRALSRVTAEARGATHVRFLVPVDAVGQAIKERAALSALIADGDSIIPAAVGNITEFNARGKEKKRTDLPLIKVSKPIYTTWRDWHGDEHSGIQYRDYDVYQRDYIPAPSEEVELKSYEGRLWYSSRVVDLETEPPQTVLHVVNFMLEIFGSFEVFDVVAAAIPRVPTRRLQWDILPPGNYPWDRAEEIVRTHLRGQSESTVGVIEERLKTLSGLNPDFMATGRGGYAGYFVFGYTRLNKYVLESVYLNNATYIFGDEWEELSSLTKDQILNGDMEYERIIHDQSWRRNIGRTLRA
jgi:hypothetical protein